LTQAVVAAECGWPQSVIAKIEQGERRIDVVEFVWIAAAMGAHPVRLFGKFAAKLSPPEPVDADGAGKKKAEKPRDAANPRAVKATKRRPRQRISNKTVAAGSVTQ
jgi:transcriptional regulator with XRE-family HTH domain